MVEDFEKVSLLLEIIITKREKIINSIGFGGETLKKWFFTIVFFLTLAIIPTENFILYNST